MGGWKPTGGIYRDRADGTKGNLQIDEDQTKQTKKQKRERRTGRLKDRKADRWTENGHKKTDQQTYKQT